MRQHKCLFMGGRRTESCLSSPRWPEAAKTRYHATHPQSLISSLMSDLHKLLRTKNRSLERPDPNDVRVYETVVVHAFYSANLTTSDSNSFDCAALRAARSLERQWEVRPRERARNEVVQCFSPPAICRRGIQYIWRAHLGAECDTELGRVELTF